MTMSLYRPVLFFLSLIFMRNAAALQYDHGSEESAVGCLSSNLVNASSLNCLNAEDNVIKESTEQIMPLGTVCLQPCVTNLEGSGTTTQQICGLSAEWGFSIVGCPPGSDISRKRRSASDIIKCLFHNCDNTDRNPPSLTCYPVTPKFFTAPIRKTTARVTWREPTATDQECGTQVTIMQITEKASGSEFSEGLHDIRYLAMDCHSLSAQCDFPFTVLVTKCDRFNRPYHGNIECSPEYPVWGSTCTFSCLLGYEVIGTAKQTCNANGKWSHDRVTCQKVTCPIPFHPNTTILDGTCTDAEKYESVCLYKCKEGLTLPTGGSRQLQCQADQTWTGQVSDCVDRTRPEIQSCPKSISRYADWAIDTTVVTWGEPTVMDTWDTKIQINQTTGLTSGSEFPVGEHSITYEAKDAAGNNAVPCTFTVHIRKTQCPPLANQKYLNISCPEGLGYGSKCSFECHNSYPLIGVAEVYCNRMAHDKAAGFWDWGQNQTQTYCKETACPDLHRPINGGLACSTWLLGDTCSMFCNADFDIPRTVSSVTTSFVWVCDTTVGTWNQYGYVPDCTAARSARESYLPSELHYFSGNCNDPEVQEEIASAFIEILSNSGYATLCTQYPQCTAGNVRVSCGEISGKKKRSVDIFNRVRRDASHTHDILILFDFLIDFSDEAAADPTQLIDNLDNTFKIIEQYIQTKINNGSFDLKVSGLDAAIDASSFNTLGYAELQCPPGSTPAYSTLTCAVCPTGTYYSETSSDCVFCNKGEYQDEDGQTQCKLCPDGTSTLAEGARHQSDCLNMCPPGHFSDTGLVNCTACPLDHFQQDQGQTSCDPCPASTFTKNTGSTSTAQCLGDGSVCDTDPCNGHTCVPQASAFTCECRPGYTGATCDDIVPKCDTHLCRNGATCQEEPEGYSCNCTDGFHGRYCQYEIVNGGWSEWYAQTECNATCGGGTQIRTRSCDQPKPGIYGKNCEGEETEIFTCNTRKCPECDALKRSYGNELSCQSNSTHKNCTVSCRTGLTFVSNPNPYYFCGPQTNWQWSHQLQDKTATLPKCLTSRAAEILRVKNVVEFLEAPCSPSKQDVDKTTKSINGSINGQLGASSCLENGICELSTSVQPCDQTNRRKRGTGLSLIITLTTTIKNSDFQGNGSLSEQEVSSRVDEYSNQLVGITRVAMAFDQLVQTDSLTITIDGSPFTADKDTFTQSGDLICSHGSEQHGLVCALCLEGHLSSSGEQCEECPQHSYQDLEGQSSCKPCPSGTGTNFTAATHVAQCQNDSAPAAVETPPSQEVNLALIIGCAVSGFFVFVLVIVIATVAYLKKYGQNKKPVSPITDMKNADPSASYVQTISDVPPRKECNW